MELGTVVHTELDVWPYMLIVLGNSLRGFLIFFFLQTFYIFPQRLVLFLADCKFACYAGKTFY